MGLGSSNMRTKRCEGCGEMAATIIPSKIDVIFQGQIYFVLNATYIGTSRPGFIY